MAILRSSDVAERRLRSVLGDFKRGKGPRKVAFAPAGKGSVERYQAREDAKAVSAMLRSLERPRFEEAAPAVNPWLVDKVVLVFEDAPPVEVSIPPLDIAPPRPIIYAPPETEEVRAMREKRTKAEQFELDRDIRAAARFGLSVAMTAEEIDEPTVDQHGRRVLVDGLEPILDQDECALAAYRALVDEGVDAGPRVIWSVVLFEDGRRVSRLYVGSETSLRRQFPDLDEVERMKAASIRGALNYERDEETGELVEAGYSLPASPVRVRFVGYDRGPRGHG